jgi:hypothetical protein
MSRNGAGCSFQGLTGMTARHRERTVRADGTLCPRSYRFYEPVFLNWTILPLDHLRWLASRTEIAAAKPILELGSRFGFKAPSLSDIIANPRARDERHF